MEVYRLAREKFTKPLSGKGAAIKGARWNSVGVELIYTAGNRSLAMAEVAVHFTLATLTDDYMMVSIFFPDDIKTARVTASQLPPAWNAFPHSIATQRIGDEFVTENHAIMMYQPLLSSGLEEIRQT